MGINTYVPFLNGEPFIFPRIYTWLDYMQKHHLRVAIHTNAELIDVDKLCKYSNIKRINCSLGGATKGTYDKIMRGPKFEKVVGNIKKLIDKVPKKVRVSMVVCEENAHEVELFKKIWGKYAKVARDINWAGAKESYLDVPKKQRPCDRILKTITILWDGRVCLCCMDYDGKVILGDLNIESLEGINARIEVLRERHRKLDFDMPLCRVCNNNY